MAKWLKLLLLKPMIVFEKLVNIFSLFFAKRLTQQVKELFSSTIILNLGISAITIFEPVFLYLFFSNAFGAARALQLVLVFYLAVYVLYFLVLPLGAKFARKFGYEHSIALSTVFTALFYLSLYGFNRFSWLAYPAIIFYVAWKMFYWPAYHADFARFSSDGEQGRQISNLSVMLSMVYVLGPLVGGLILEYFGFKVLFVVVAILMIVSNVPMLITKEEFTPVPFSYRDAFRRLFAPRNRRKFWTNFGFGEEVIVLVVWPIFIYLAVGDFLGLGFFSAISVFVTSLTILFVGRIVDKSDRRVVLRFGAIFYFFSWVFRLLARSVLGIFAVDAYSRIAKEPIGLSVVASTYENAQDGSVMNTILFFEMSLVFGKIVALILALILLQIFAPGWNALFILAAIFSLFYLLF